MPNRIKMDALKESLQIRLLERLREDESGVYTPSTRISMSKYPQGRFNFTVQFSCAPENTDKLIASALDEIGILKKQGPPDVDLEKFKAETMRSLESASSTNGFWLSYVSGQLLNDEPIEQMDDYIETLKTLKSTDVQETAAKYLKGDNYIRLVLMPETNKPN
jgi:zinc protease